MSEQAELEQRSKPVIVLKLGGSILTDHGAIGHVAAEVDRYVRKGYSVIAVTSAFAGRTDTLLSLAGDCTRSAHLPYLLATGESESAALLALWLEHKGHEAILRLPHEIRLRAEGEAWDGDLVSVDVDQLLYDLALYDVVIVPGFFAENADGRHVLLGRGGTDLSAVFLGAAIADTRIRLIKDVDGVYEADPKQVKNPQRYAYVSYEDALQYAAPLIQPKTVNFARAHNLNVEIAALHSPYETVLCDASRLVPTSQPQSLTG